MVGIRLILIMAVVGGFIAYLADKLGSRIGKRKLSVFGLRPKHTSVLLTVLSGIVISLLSIITVSVSSESARTALFGMEKIQRELHSLNNEKEQASRALQEARENVAEQNEKIAVLNKGIAAASVEKEKMESALQGVNEKYTAAQNEVKSLSEARIALSSEVSELEEVTNRLRQGIISMREGEVYYRAGEVVYAAVLGGGMTPAQNREQLDWFLHNGNQAAIQRLDNFNPEKPVQMIWISQEIVDEAMAILNKSKGGYLCRLRTVANIFVGELVVCELELIENKLVYNDKAEVFKKLYDNRNSEMPADALILSFLTEVNQAAVAKGVVPDPVSGKVGNLEAGTMVTASNEIKDCRGRFTLIAYAKGDVTTAGPVRIGLRVKPEKEAGDGSYDL